MSADSAPEVSRSPAEGWHCTHAFYEFDRDALDTMDDGDVTAGRRHFCDTLDATRDGQPERMQTSIVSGHKADFGLMMLDPDPLRLDSIHQRLLSGPFASAIVPTYSFISLTEVSEYVPTVEQYGQRLVAEGETEGSDAYNAKLNAYRKREEMMRRQRLTPDFPPWPCTCFYPMNKIRDPHANWFTLPVERRNELMAEHGRTGMQFGGKVTQLITVSVGLDDWEWGVTLWARNPEFLKDIVYRMRFDEASAKYAEFGPFYTSYIATPEEILDHCRVGFDS